MLQFESFLGLYHRLHGATTATDSVLLSDSKESFRACYLALPEGV